MTLPTDIEALETLLSQLESPEISVDDAIPLYQSALKKSQDIAVQFKKSTEKLKKIEADVSQLSLEDLAL